MWTYTPESSNVERWCYCADDDGSAFYVVFKGGKPYAYRDVPVPVARQLADADSIGSAVHQLLRKGGFECAKLTPSELASELMAEMVDALVDYAAGLLVGPDDLTITHRAEVEAVAGDLLGKLVGGGAD